MLNKATGELNKNSQQISLTLCPYTILIPNLSTVMRKMNKIANVNFLRVCTFTRLILLAFDSLNQILMKLIKMEFRGMCSKKCSEKGSVSNSDYS